MKKIILTLVISFISIISFSQISNIDTLLICKYIDSAKVHLYNAPQITKLYADSALITSNKLDYKIGKAKSYDLLGNYYYFRSNFEKAVEAYIKAGKLWEKIGREKKIANMYGNIGLIYCDMNKYDDAIDFYLKAEKIFKKINDNYSIANVNNSIGIAKIANNDTAEALVYYKKALSIAQQFSNDTINKKKGSLIAIIYGNIANLYSQQNLFDKALKYHFNSLKEFNRIEDNRNVSTSLNNIAVIYRKQNKLIKSIEYSNKALILCKQINKITTLHLVYKNLSASYELLDEHKKALEFYKKYKTINDSIYNEKTNSKIINLIKEHEIAIKERQNISLKDKNKIQVIRLFYALIVMLLILVILVILVFLYKQSVQKNKELVKINLEIVASEKSAVAPKIVSNKLNDTKKLVNSDTKKYAGLEIDDELINSLYQNIIKAVEEERIFMRSDITVQKFAEHINTNSSYLSRVINQKIGVNFSNFINNYRVKEARKLLADNSTKKYTIEHISSKVGFKSISTFNRAFKKFTGITPSFFLQNL